MLVKHPAYLHHHCLSVAYEEANQALFGFATLQLVGFGPALLLGLLVEPGLCLQSCQSLVSAKLDKGVLSFHKEGDQRRVYLRYVIIELLQCFLAVNEGVACAFP